MSNDERVKKLEALLDVALERADTLRENKTQKQKVDKSKLKKLAKDIRKSLEEHSVETTSPAEFIYRTQH